MGLEKSRSALQQLFAGISEHAGGAVVAVDEAVGFDVEHDDRASGAVSISVRKCSSLSRRAEAARISASRKALLLRAANGTSGRRGDLVFQDVVVVTPSLMHFDGHLVAERTGEQDERSLRVLFNHRGQRIHAGPALHAEIGEHDVVIFFFSRACG